MVTIFSKECKVIGTSRNLRGILERTRKLGPKGLKVTVGYAMVGGGCTVSCTWADDSFTNVFFASKAVAAEWVKRRSLEDADVEIKPNQTLAGFEK